MGKINTNLPYDEKDKYSIWEYSKLLLNKTLNEAVGGIPAEYNSGKGRLGQMVEKYFFGYEPNSDPTPDFSEANLELKCTPLKQLANRTLPDFGNDSPYLFTPMYEASFKGTKR